MTCPGLDARAAAIVIRAVKNTCKSGRTVIVTIHQPSVEIFEAFDALVLLQKGGKVRPTAVFLWCLSCLAAVALSCNTCMLWFCTPGWGCMHLFVDAWCSLFHHVPPRHGGN